MIYIQHLIIHIIYIYYIHLFKARIKENIKAPRHWPLWGEFTGDEFPAQGASNAENDSIWWRHHVVYIFLYTLRFLLLVIFNFCVITINLYDNVIAIDLKRMLNYVSIRHNQMAIQVPSFKIIARMNCSLLYQHSYRPVAYWHYKSQSLCDVYPPILYKLCLYACIILMQDKFIWIEQNWSSFNQTSNVCFVCTNIIFDDCCAAPPYDDSVYGHSFRNTDWTIYRGPPLYQFHMLNYG